MYNVFSYFLEARNQESLPTIQAFKAKAGIEKNSPFMFLADLFKESMICSKTEHLDYLVSLLNAISQKTVDSEKKESKLPFTMSEESVKHLCLILTKTDDMIMKKLSQLISVICL